MLVQGCVRYSVRARTVHRSITSCRIELDTGAAGRSGADRGGGGQGREGGGDGPGRGGLGRGRVGAGRVRTGAGVEGRRRWTGSSRASEEWMSRGAGAGCPVLSVGWGNFRG